MIRAHVNAYTARLEQDTILAGDTFVDNVSGNPERYCIVYSNQGLRRGDRLLGPSSNASFEFIVHSVGRTADQCRLVAERVMAQSLDALLVVPGRTCWPITHEASQPIRFDDDGPDPKFYAVDVFRLASTPA